MGKGVRGGALERCLACEAEDRRDNPDGTAPRFAHSLRIAWPRPVGLASEAASKNARFDHSFTDYVSFRAFLGLFLVTFDAKFGG
jgi:hypothetical protein